MSAGVLTLPAKKSRQPRTNDVPTKIDADVLRECKMVAAGRGVTVAEYISETLRPIAHRDLAAEAAESKAKK